MKHLPLRDWVGFGVGSLHLPPSVVWGMSIRDLFAALERWNAEQGGGDGRDGLDRDGLADLMRRFPD